MCFIGTNICTGTEVAIKLECIRTRHPQLHIESKIYKVMQGGREYSNRKLLITKINVKLKYLMHERYTLNTLLKIIVYECVQSWNTRNEMVRFRR